MRLTYTFIYNYQIYTRQITNSKDWNCNERKGEVEEIWSNIETPLPSPLERMMAKGSPTITLYSHMTTGHVTTGPVTGHINPLLPLLGDVSELLLDGVAIDIDEAEGFGGGSGESAPLGWVPTARGSPHAVHAGSLDLLHALLDGIETFQKSRVRVGKGDVQQLSVVVLVLHHLEVSSLGSEENHFGSFDICLVTQERRKTKGLSFGSTRKTPPFADGDSV